MLSIAQVYPILLSSMQILKLVLSSLIGGSGILSERKFRKIIGIHMVCQMRFLGRQRRPYFVFRNYFCMASCL